MRDPLSRVAVIGPDDGATEAIRRAITATGRRLVGPTDADAVVTVGDAALRDMLVGQPDPSDYSETVDGSPILPVRGDPHGDGETPADMVRRLVESPPPPVSHPVVAVDIDEDHVHRAAFDIALVTDEPARISEYALDLPVHGRVTVRADGVVVATPLGSTGYANAAGGPITDPGAGLAVVPISPFTIDDNTWVVSGGVTLSVERDAEAVSVVVDGDRREAVGADQSVQIETVEHVELLFDRGGSDAAAIDRKGSNNS